MLTRQEVLGAAEAASLPLSDYEGIAALLSVERTKLVSTEIGVGTILAVMAPNGGLFLDALEQMAALTPSTADSANVKWTLEVIKARVFDVGMPAVREQLAVFAAAYPNFAESIQRLLDLAVAPDPVTGADVAAVVQGNE